MLLTYDITRHESFEYVSSVYRRLISKASPFPALLIDNLTFDVVQFIKYVR